MLRKSYKELLKERLAIINSGKSTFLPPNESLLSTFEEIVELQLGCNKCFTLYDMQRGKFVKWHLVEEVFGYRNDEFTIQAINNIGYLKIIHEDDIKHKLRYDDIIYSIIGSLTELRIRMDCYSLSLRMIHKNGNIIPIKRSSYIFEAYQHIPICQFDEWEVNNRYKANHVFPELIVSSPEFRNQISEDFYNRNLIKLGIELSNDALRVLHYRVKGFSNLKIKNLLFIEEQSVANIHNKNFQKLESSFGEEIYAIKQEYGKSNPIKKREISNINIFREICKKYGLYPVPDSILDINALKKGG